MINYRKPKFWLVLASVLILILVGNSLLSNSGQGKSLSFPPSKNQEVVLKPGPVIYLKDASTNHSLGAVGSKFSFTEDKLVVEEKEETKFFEISYDKTTLSLDEFQKQLQMDEEFPDGFEPEESESLFEKFKYPILALLLVFLAILGFKLYKKKKREREDKDLLDE